jgi:hypothetical protein
VLAARAAQDPSNAGARVRGRNARGVSLLRTLPEDAACLPQRVRRRPRRLVEVVPGLRRSPRVAGAAMTDDEEKATAIFNKAVALLKKLKKIDPNLQLYSASGTLCLMQGDSHDEYGRPRREAVIATASGLTVGGDW